MFGVTVWVGWVLDFLGVLLWVILVLHGGFMGCLGLVFALVVVVVS